jgi:hypothetical protein
LMSACWPVAGVPMVLIIGRARQWWRGSSVRVRHCDSGVEVGAHFDASVPARSLSQPDISGNERLPGRFG